MRWWKEFLNPSLKCERVGHKLKTTKGVDVLLEPGELYFMCVARNATATVTRCKRCGHLEPLRDIEEGSTIQRLSMPSDRMRELERNGWIVW